MSGFTIDAETVYVLSPLPVDDGVRGSAVQLFLDRWRRSRGQPSAEDLALVSQVCRDLDGLPLAIELAASRRTRLLTADEAALFARLAMFPASFSLTQVEMVCADDHVAVDRARRLAARGVEVAGGPTAVAAAEALDVAADLAMFDGRIDQAIGNYRTVSRLRAPDVIGVLMADIAVAQAHAYGQRWAAVCTRSMICLPAHTRRAGERRHLPHAAGRGRTDGHRRSRGARQPRTHLAVPRPLHRLERAIADVCNRLPAPTAGAALAHGATLSRADTTAVVRAVLDGVAG